ncbi:MAG: flagellar basal body P-ring formation protein FlgA [Alphaproteobacteria bacterium]|nr:flagellar basal body P-ring formation protein FlgA [Alphaproteobacteria bacterium]
MNMKRPLELILCAAIVGGWPLLAVAAPQLRSPIIVEGPNLTLGHIFEDAGSAADVRVGPSPEPGERTVIRPGHLARFAKQHGLSWTPGPAVNTVVILRSSTRLAADDVAVALRQALRDAGARGHFDVELRTRNLNVALPLDSTFELDIERLSYDEESGRFTASLRVAGDGFATKEVALDGTAHSVVEVPVTTRSISKGEVIGETDIAWVEIRGSQVGRRTVTELDQLVGQEAKRQIRPDKPIRVNDVWAQRLVRKGSLVNIIVETRYMVLQTSGQAAEDGALGDVVRVMNLKSRRTVQGIVSADGEIKIPHNGAFQSSAAN